ncbi:MAG TPA: hypothetical protein VHU88_18175 [Sporichthyaceae bacterium]|nr:hypothetical protein [Sporichthyaceae bacterium]
MIAAASLVAVVALGVIINRLAVVALTLTGLSRDIAWFQARSAYYGVGFTTAESEDVVNDPGRRWIIMTLALIGNAGVATTMASLLLSFTGATRGQAVERPAVIMAALVGVAVLAHSGYLGRHFSRLARRALCRWTDLELRDYARLLGVRDGSRPDSCDYTGMTGSPRGRCANSACRTRGCTCWAYSGPTASTWEYPTVAPCSRRTTSWFSTATRSVWPNSTSDVAAPSATTRTRAPSGSVTGPQ